MKMLILAGGYGKRLQNLISNVPKPLAPINEIPFIKILLNFWISNNINDFTFLLHFKSQQMINFLKNFKRSLPNKIKIDWLIENEPMGTGGAIKNALNQLNLKNEFLVSNADTWLDCGIKKIFRSPSPSILVVKSKDISRYGEVSFNKKRLVTQIHEKQKINCSGWVNGGQYKLSPQLFQNFPNSFFSLEDDFLPKLVKSKTLKAVISKGNFIDIGIPEDYLKFCEWYKSKKTSHEVK